MLKSTKSNFGWGSAQTPLGRLQRSPHPLTGEERLAVPPKHATPPRPFVPRYSPPLVSRYSAPGTDEIYNFRCKRNNAIYIYTIYRGSAYTHTRAVRTFPRKVQHLQGRPTLYIVYLCICKMCSPYIENCIFRPSRARKSLTRNINA